MILWHNIECSIMKVQHHSLMKLPSIRYEIGEMYKVPPSLSNYEDILTAKCRGLEMAYEDPDCPALNLYWFSKEKHSDLTEMTSVKEVCTQEADLGKMDLSKALSDQGPGTTVKAENDKVAEVKFQHKELIKMKKATEKEHSDLKSLRTEQRFKNKALPLDEQQAKDEAFEKAMENLDSFITRIIEMIEILNEMPDNEEEALAQKALDSIAILKVESPSLIDAAKSIKKNFKA